MSARRKARDTGPSRLVERLVFERDVDREGWPSCQWCGRGIRKPNYSLQHRRARGMGGSSDPTVNLPSNLILLCGSATTGCHGHVEKHRVEAGRLGFSMPYESDAREVPIDTYSNGIVYLDDRGGWRAA